MPAHSCKRFWNSKNRESVLNAGGKLEFYARFTRGSSEKRAELSRDANPESDEDGEEQVLLFHWKGLMRRV